MPLPNRVDPFGEIHAVTERGTLMGNRGIIHDSRTKTLLKRRWTTKAWIICLCEFKGRRRTPMAPGTYTELFFLDEATALAAGHRPCFECQRERAKEFARAFAAGCGNQAMAAPAMDAVLHAERLAAGKLPTSLAAEDLADLPNGTMIAAGGDAFLLFGGRAWPWSFAGYGTSVALDALSDRALSAITPAATCAALRHGFVPATALTAP